MVRLETKRGGFEVRVKRLAADHQRIVAGALTDALEAWASGTIAGGGLAARMRAGAAQKFSFTPRISGRYMKRVERQYGPGTVYRGPRNRDSSMSLLKITQALAGKGDALAVFAAMAKENRDAARPHAGDAVLRPGGHQVRAKAAKGVVRVMVTLPALNIVNRGGKGRAAIYAREIRELRRGGQDQIIKKMAQFLFDQRLAEMRKP